MQMRATQRFHRGLLFGVSQIKRKEIQRNTLKYFWEFFGFLEQANKREKQKREKLFTRESSQQVKEEQKIFLGFVLILQLN